jgi:hypothetical protein
MSMEELADGFALWQEHRPHNREDWLNVARRWHQKGLEPPDNPAPMFGALYDAWAEVERLRRWIDTEGRNCPSYTTVDALLATGPGQEQAP